MHVVALLFPSSPLTENLEQARKIIIISKKQLLFEMMKSKSSSTGHAY